jgi:hypothetical protein
MPIERPRSDSMLVAFRLAQEWVHWWQTNHALLILNSDGRKLTLGR